MYCGSSIPPSHLSSSNEMLIHFQSDYSVPGAGFKMEYNPTGKQKTLIQTNTELELSCCNRQTAPHCSLWLFSSVVEQKTVYL